MKQGSKSAIIIGAGGQIGADLVNFLYLKGISLKLFDRLPYTETNAYPKLLATFGSNEKLAKVWTQGDANDSDLAVYLSNNKSDQIYHLAALLSATGEMDPMLCWQVNMNSLLIVLNFLKTQKNTKTTLIWPSSIAAFGSLCNDKFTFENPVANDFPLLPLTMYGVTKAAGEMLGNYYYSKFGVDFRCVRLPGLINATTPGGGSTDFAPQMYFDAIAGRNSICFVRPDTRLPFLYMDDAIRALWEISSAEPKSLTCRIYNLNGISISANEFSKSIKKYFPEFKVTYSPDFRQKIVDSWPIALDDNLAKHDWGWHVKFDLDKITSKLIELITN